MCNFDIDMLENVNKSIYNNESIIRNLNHLKYIVMWVKSKFGMKVKYFRVT